VLTWFNLTELFRFAIAIDRASSLATRAISAAAYTGHMETHKSAFASFSQIILQFSQPPGAGNCAYGHEITAARRLSSSASTVSASCLLNLLMRLLVILREVAEEDKSGAARSREKRRADRKFILWAMVVVGLKLRWV